MNYWIIVGIVIVVILILALLIVLPQYSTAYWKQDPETTILAKEEDLLELARENKNKRIDYDVLTLMGNAKLITGIEDDRIIELRAAENLITNRAKKELKDPRIPLIVNHVAYVSELWMKYLTKESDTNPIKLLLKDDYSLIPSRITPGAAPKSKSSIPRIIHQTFATNALPAHYAQAAFSWINKNSDYEYRYYNDDDMRNYLIENNFIRELAAYDSLIPFAYKADLWRLCVLYREGGVYADIKTGCIKSLNETIPSETELLLVSDRPKASIFNAIMASVPEHPLIGKMIDRIIENILQRKYGKSDLDITGPEAIGKVVVEELKLSSDQRIQEGDYDKIRILELENIGSPTRNINFKAKTEFHSRHNNKLCDLNTHSKLTGRKHYSILWRERKVFE